MNKVFIFSLCNGSYEYAICFIQAESLEEAVKIGTTRPQNLYSYEGLSSSNNIQGYNFDYKEHINRFSYLNNSNLLGNLNWLNDKDLINNHHIFNQPYEALLATAPKNCIDLLLDNKEYLITDTDFYDVMEVLMPVPLGYIYSNGHSG